MDAKQEKKVGPVWMIEWKTPFHNCFVLLHEYLKTQIKEAEVLLGAGNITPCVVQPSCIIMSVPFLDKADDGVSYFLVNYKTLRAVAPEASIIWLVRDMSQTRYYRPCDFQRSTVIPAEGSPHPEGALRHLVEAIKEAVYIDKVTKGMWPYSSPSPV